MFKTVYDLYVLNRQTGDYELIKENMSFEDMFEMNTRLTKAGCCVGIECERRWVE